MLRLRLSTVGTNMNVGMGLIRHANVIPITHVIWPAKPSNCGDEFDEEKATHD